MKITQLDSLDSSVPAGTKVFQGFIKKEPKSFLSLSIFVYEEKEKTNEEYKLSCSFITPVSGDDKTVDSMFSLHNVLSGYSIDDVITKFLAAYEKFGIFNDCDLGDQIYVSWSDESTSLDYFVSKIITEIQIKNGEFSERLKGTSFDNSDSLSPRLVK